MSGGSFNYLYNRRVGAGDRDFAIIQEQIPEFIDTIKGAAYRGVPGRQYLTFVLRKILCLCTEAEDLQNRINGCMDKISDFLHAVEWYESCDWGMDSVVKYGEKLAKKIEEAQNE